jgi:hypothetical protein
MRADETQADFAQLNRSGNGYTALQYKGELYSPSTLERECRQDGVSPVARAWSIPHGWGIPQIQPQGSSRLYDIFLFPEPCNQHSSDSALLERWDRRIAPVRLLYQDDQWEPRIRAQGGIVTVPDPPYDGAEPAPPDPQVPAQYDEATG